MKNKNTLLIFVFLFALVGLFWVPFAPMEQAFREHRFAGPSWPHLLGIDGLGRDVFSRLWRGLGNTAYMGLFAVMLTACITASLFLLERKGGRIVQQGMTLLMSVWLGLPVLFVSLMLIVFLKPSATTLVLAASLGNVPLAFRQLRILWLEQRGALYVQVSETLGATGWGLFYKTLWPNLWPDLLALGKLVFAMAVLEISGLAFLGLIGDPDFPELGTILRQNQSYLLQNEWLLIYPGLLLCGLLSVVHLSKD